MDYDILINKDFDNYYLFLDNEFRMDSNFGEKIYTLDNKNFEEILFSVILPLPGINTDGKESKLTIPYHFKSEKLFYETKFENGLELCMLDHLINSDSKLWEVFVSERLELCLFGCKRELNNSLLTIFNPYLELSLKEKYCFLADAHFEIDSLLNYLEENFKLTMHAQNM